MSVYVRKHCFFGALSPGIVYRTFGNRTQSNSIELNPWIEFDWFRQLNEIEHRTLCEFDFRTNRINRTNRTESNSIHWIVFDWVRLANSIEHSPMDYVRLCSVNKFAWTKVMLCGLTARLVIITVCKLWWTYIKGKPIENTFFSSFFLMIIQ